MTSLLLLLLAVSAWAQGPDQVSTPQLTFDTNDVTACTGRKLVGGNLAFCTSDGAQAIVVTSLTPETIPPDPPPTVTTSSAPATSTTTTTLADTAYYYVRADGSDTACDGSQDEAAGDGTCAWATLSKAGTVGSITPDTAGAIVYVGPGLYTSRVRTYTVGTAAAPIKFISQVKWGAVLSLAASGGAMWEVRGAHQTIDGFQFADSPGWEGAVGCYVGSTTSTGHHCTVVNNYILNIAQTATSESGRAGCPQFGAISTAVGTSTTDALSGYNVVRGNVIRHIGSEPDCNSTHGIYTSGSYDVIQNNLISGVVGWGIHGYGDHRFKVLSNNTIFNNNQGGILIESHGAKYSTLQYMTMANNIVVNNGKNTSFGIGGISIYENGSTNNLFNANLLYGNTGKYAGDDNWFKGTTADYHHVPCADPCDDANMQTGSDSATFVNYQSDWNDAPDMDYDHMNYALKAASTAIDTGGSACVSGGFEPCVPTDDIVGQARPTDAAYDIGAFEYDSGASTTTTTATTSTTTTTLTYAPDWTNYMTSALTMETSVTTDSGGGSCTWSGSELTRGSTQVVVGNYSANAALYSDDQTTACSALGYTSGFACGGWYRIASGGGSSYDILARRATNKGYDAQWFSNDVFWRTGAGSDVCEMQTTTNFLPANTWAFFAGISTTSAMRVWANGDFQSSTCASGCSGSGTSCTYSGLSNSATNLTLAGGVAGYIDDFFCDAYSASASSDGTVDHTSLCRILACGLDGKGCQCAGATYATGTGAGSRYALYGNGCTLPDCNQEQP